MTSEFIVFSSFIVLIILMLVLDLGVFNKNNHEISIKEASVWSLVWIGLSIIVYVFIRYYGNLLHGIEDKEALQALIDKYKHPINIDNLSFNEALNLYNHNLSLEYITGYIIEKALSVDNIFIIIMIFMAFKVDLKYYHRVLFWGIIGAIVLRFIFIFLTSALIQKFDWILYIFGGILVFTGVKMFLSRNKEDEVDAEHHFLVRFASKHLPFTKVYHGKNFSIKENGKRLFTPLFLVLIVIEFTDVIFAVDSIPAIFSITMDPYVVFFSNIFAILGLRSLFFLLVHFMNMFHYLKTGLAVLLTFIGAKLFFHTQLVNLGFETSHSLYVIVIILTISVVASLVFPKKNEKPE